VKLVGHGRKLPEKYSGRTPRLVPDYNFHVNLPPRLYKGRQGPPRGESSSKAIQTTHDVGYYALGGPNLSKTLC
jgi:hypothetical protein